MTDQEIRDTLRQMLGAWNAATPEQRQAAMEAAAEAARKVTRGICANCGEDIHTHKPSHGTTSGPCWIHDDGGMHGCGPEFHSDCVAEPVQAAS